MSTNKKTNNQTKSPKTNNKNLSNKNLSNKKQDKFDLMKDEEGRLYSNESILRGILRHTFLNAVQSPSGDPNDPNAQRYVDNLDPGLFTKNVNGWDIQKACNWIHTHAANSSMHECARYVRMGIEAGGISTEGRPRYAWKYIYYLPKIGFKFIDKVDNSYKGEHGPYKPEPGDIAVYTKGGDKSVPGHICMWTGSEWASDFRQRSMIVYNNTPQAYVFRFES